MRNLTISIMACVLLPGIMIITSCSSEPESEAEPEKATTSTEVLLPTRGLEFDEDGNPTPESAEQIILEEKENGYQEYLNQQAEEAYREYYLSLPDPDWDNEQDLPGGH